MPTLIEKTNKITATYDMLRSTLTMGVGGTKMTKEEEEVYHSIKIANRYKPSRECFVYTKERVLEFTEVAYANIPNAIAFEISIGYLGNYENEDILCPKF